MRGADGHFDRVFLRVEAFVDYINGGENPPDNVRALCDELETGFDQAMDRFVETDVENVQPELAPGEGESAALEEIESSLEDLHELMSTEDISVDTIETQGVETQPPEKAPTRGGHGRLPTPATPPGLPRRSAGPNSRDAL